MIEMIQKLLATVGKPRICGCQPVSTNRNASFSAPNYCHRRNPSGRCAAILIDVNGFLSLWTTRKDNLHEDLNGVNANLTCCLQNTHHITVHEGLQPSMKTNQWSKSTHCGHNGNPYWAVFRPIGHSRPITASKNGGLSLIFRQLLRQT